MNNYKFIDEKGTFYLEQPENTNCLYFPIASEEGMKGSITPTLFGDSKLDQNTFILEPVSSENLHNNKSSRNFWCQINGKDIFSCTGVSAGQMAERFTNKQEKSTLTAGLMWQTIKRDSKEFDLHTEITSFVSVHENVEIMMVSITNCGKQTIEFTPTAAIPLYGRSASNIRDHRHVTSLLHRIKTTDIGVEVTPTLSFDERGHQLNNITYFVCGFTQEGESPEDFYPVVEDFIGEGGSFERPLAVIKNSKGVSAGVCMEGLEAIGGLHFRKKVLKETESTSYIVLIGAVKKENDIMSICKKYSNLEKVTKELEKVKAYWEEKVNVTYHTGHKSFDSFMHWVSFQPILRRIYGCSFLPHHDYGKGGRGWRDLWQDCLALLIMNPDGVRQMLIDNFGGVRMDGTNATIIGNKQGEFIADRNNIARVWMDHGIWPCMTTKLYIDQTGDLDILMKKVPYFKDRQVVRGTDIDMEWNDSYGCWQKDVTGNIYLGSVLEHLLLQNLTSFYEVGEHNEIRLRGADWNDALDMADENGESVAFSNAIAGNLKDLAELVENYSKITGENEIFLAKEIQILLESNKESNESIKVKNKILKEYSQQCIHNISGEKIHIEIDKLTNILCNKANFMINHIRTNEWVTDHNHYGWFNGYYDNHGNKVEGDFESGIRMMLTGQVFSIMSGTATMEQTKSICKSADAYLYNKEIGGYRLNTDFHEVKTDLGRMFGFSYGDKENGAVFCHMAVMYANALYKRGFVKEGYKALTALSDQSLNFEVSKIYPGIPEYFNGKGRGMYHYLTGAASWYMLTVITEMFGVKGTLGDLTLEPKLLSQQFDDNGEASLLLSFAKKQFKITYVNRNRREYGEYTILSVTVNGDSQLIEEKRSKWVYSLTKIQLLKELNNITIMLD